MYGYNKVDIDNTLREVDSDSLKKIYIYILVVAWRTSVVGGVGQIPVLMVAVLSH